MKHYQIWCVMPDVYHRLTDDVDPKLALTHHHYWKERLHIQEVIVDIPETKKEEKTMTPTTNAQDDPSGIGRSDTELAYLYSVGLLCLECRRGKMHYERAAQLWWCDECLGSVDISMPESENYSKPGAPKPVEILQKSIPSITVSTDRRVRVTSIIEAYIQNDVDIEYSYHTSPEKTDFLGIAITGVPAHVELAFVALLNQNEAEEIMIA